MYCNKCGRKFNEGEQFCADCGNKREVVYTISNNNQSSSNIDNTKSNKRVVVILIIVFVVVPLIVVLALSSGLIKYIFNSNLIYSDSQYLDAALKDSRCKGESCISKDDLEKISEEEVTGAQDKKVKQITYRVKDTDYEFVVKPSYVCKSEFFCLKNCDPCDYRTWELKSSFTDNLTTYTIKQYNKKINYDDKYCDSEHEEYKYKNLKVESEQDVQGLIDYIKGYLEYVNTLNHNQRQLFYFNYDFTIAFYNEHYLHVWFKTENNKIVFSYDDSYRPDDGKFETYVNNFLNKWK